MTGCSAEGIDVESFDPHGAGAAELPPSAADALAGDRDPTRDGGGYGILLFDTTSSMSTVRSTTGNTRCHDGKIMAHGIINDFFNPARVDGDGIAIWAFRNNPTASDDVQPTITGYYIDAASAIAAVDALSCEGSSPLADSLCKGSNGDGETFAIDPVPNHLYIVTDGYEDNSDGPCAGPSGSYVTPGTWQYKAMAEMVSTGVRVHTRYWVDPTFLASPETIDSFAAEGEPSDPTLEELQLVADIEELPPATIDRLMNESNAAGEAAGGEKPADGCGVACQELGLFAELAKISGGTWGIVKDDDPSYPLEDTVDPDSGPVHPKLGTATPVAEVEEAGQ